jgi:transcriptional regulator with XRE-family HTH domain
VAAGLSLRDAAAASGASRSQLWRFERGDTDRVAISELGAWFSVLGMDVVMRAYPAGDPIRDRAQLALLERLRARLHPTLRWRTEVPLPIDGDLRAWDAEIRATPPDRWRVRVEAETRIADAQALERRLALKRRDDPDGHVILLVADTRANRAVLAGLRDGLRATLPLGQRAIMAALAAGHEPGGSGIVVM